MLNLRHERANATDVVPRECPDPSVCPASRTNVLFIEGGPPGSAFATLFYVFVVNGVLYSWHKKYVPHIAFNAEWSKRTMGDSVTGDELWAQFFRPFCPGVAELLARCPETVVALRKPLKFWYPEVHYNFEWPVRSFYYGKYVTLRCQRERWCNVTTGLRGDWGDAKRHHIASATYQPELFRRWRASGAAVVARAHRLQPHLAAEVHRRWRETMHGCDAARTLAVHMRGTDKANGRRVVGVGEWEPHVASFLQSFPASGAPRACVFVATDSSAFARAVNGSWASRWAGAVRMQAITTRAERTANFREHEDKLAVATDVLLDIQLMARCRYFLYGASAVAEAVFYTNPGLQAWSYNLEYSEEARLPPWAERPVLENSALRTPHSFLAEGD
jgi:hypothetical protein